MDTGRGERPGRLAPIQDADLATETEAVTEQAGTRLLGEASPPLMAWYAPDGTGLIAAGQARSLVSSGAPRISDIQARATAIWNNLEYDGPAPARPRFIGGMAFDEDAGAGELWDAFPNCWFILPREQVVKTSAGAWRTVIGSRADRRQVHRDIPRLESSNDQPGRDTWLEQVGAIQRKIRSGAVTKVVLAHSRAVAISTVPAADWVITELQRAHPGCYLMVIQPTEETMFISATPERLISRAEHEVFVDALAGSRARGADDVADQRLLGELQSSDKDAHEHGLVVSAIRDTLSQFGGEITREKTGVCQLASVQHLHTPIRGEFTNPPHVLDLVDHLHPTPAVGGIPREGALSAIKTIESFDRGWYAAPIGWFDQHGDGTFAIGIRSGVLRGTRGRLFAGAGIVEKSRPADEWDELGLKYRPMVDLFEG